MAILNVTPDSFSGDGLSNRVLDAVVERALQAIEDGANILDIGGESTRPGAQEVSPEEETRRVVPLVEALAARVQIPISIDTTKSVVAHRVLQCGASIINDISGATHDAEMLPLLAQSRCGVVLMHRRGNSQTMRASQAAIGGEQSAGNDVIAEVLDFWRERVEAAEQLGMARERIALDAGFGFGKSVQENLEIVRRGRELANFGLPMLSATSRKSTIGRVLDGESEGGAPIEDRIWGTASAVALAIANGANVVRVHDVREMALVTRMSDAIARSVS
jgi:dihydropteroate synthase